MKTVDWNWFFEGRERVDATMPFRIHLYDEDFEHAVKGDPVSCLLSQGSRHVLPPNSRGTLFFLEVAWVDFIDHVERYRLSTEQSRLIVEFDKTQLWTGPRDLVLNPPTKSQTLVAKRKESATYRATHDRKKRNVSPQRARFFIRGSRQYLDRLAKEEGENDAR